MRNNPSWKVICRSPKKLDSDFQGLGSCFPGDLLAVAFKSPDLAPALYPQDP